MCAFVAVTRKDLTVGSDVFECEDIGSFTERRGVGVRASATERLVYDLVVVSGDVNDTVTSAGGWIYDRVRAGWQVTVLAPPNSDVRPLQILGVRISSFDDETDFLGKAAPAAIAVAADVLRADEGVGDEILRIVKSGTTEVTFWGDVGSIETDTPFGQLSHRLSSAARAFKTCAVASASIPMSSVGATEEFRSYAMWYPPEGADQIPVGLAGRSDFATVSDIGFR
jgi:hypothetical protein